MKQFMKFINLLIIIFALIGWGEMYGTFKSHYTSTPTVEEYTKILRGVCKTAIEKDKTGCKT